MQMSFFFMLPTILLSGFMFPFRGMPKPSSGWATAPPHPFPADRPRDPAQGQRPGGELWPAIWPIMVFMAAVTAVGLMFYRRTLD